MERFVKPAAKSGFGPARSTPAQFWKKRGARIVCELCPRRCVLSEGQLGACGVRKVVDGTLRALTYGRPCALNVDPVEKKPLFHFYPGEPIFSLATIGCNLFCDFCQNWQISTARADALVDEKVVSPAGIVRLAREAGCRLIAFTYTEPTIYYEYMLDIAKLAKKAGVECVIVSNGYINPAPLAKLSPLLSAANIDLKGGPDFYRRRSKVPDPQPILDTIIALKKAGVHVEVTTLLIPGENDGDEEVEERARWIAEHAGRETPYHLSAFHPDHKLRDKPATPPATLLRARDLARKHLAHVYLGNVFLDPGENDTRCPACGALCIERPRGILHLKNGCCPACGHRLSGRFSVVVESSRSS